MSDFLPPVVARVVADITAYTAGMARASTEMKAFSDLAGKQTGLNAFEKHLGAVGMTAGGVGGQVTKFAEAVGVAGAIVVGSSAHMAMEFQAKMAQVHTQALAFGEDTRAMGNALLDMASQVGQSPNDLADGLYHVESAGYRGATALDMVRLSAEGASMGFANMNDVTQAMIALMAAHIKGVDTAQEAMAWLNATVGTGDMRFSDLAGSLQNGIIPVFANAGLGAKDFAAAVATITDNATRPDVATTHLLHTVAMMEAPVHKGIAALKSMGMTQYQLADDMRGPGGLQAAIHDLHEHLAKLSPDKQNQALVDLFGGARSYGTMQELNREIDRLDSKYVAGKQAVKSFEQAWEEAKNTAKQTNADFIAGVDAVRIRLGTLLLPAVTWVEKALMSLGSYIADNKWTWAALAGVAAVLAGALAAVAGSALLAAAPLLLAMAAAAALGVAFYELYTHSARARELIDRAVQGIREGVATAFAAIREWLREAQQWWHDHGAQVLAVTSDIVERGIRGFGEAVAWLRERVRQVLAFVNEWWHDHGRQVKELLQAIGAAVKFAAYYISQVWGSVWRAIADTVKTAWDLIRDVVITGLKVVSDGIGLFIDLVTGHWSHLWGDMKQLVGDELQGVWNIARDVLAGIARAFFDFGGFILHSAAAAFGWIPGLGGALKGAAKQFDEFQHQVNASIDAITGDKTVTLHVVTAGVNGVNTATGLATKLDRLSARASGGPVTAGQPYLVGERGPELVVPSTSGTVIDAQRTKGLLGSGGSGTQIGEQHFHITTVANDVQEMQRELVWAMKWGAA